MDTRMIFRERGLRCTRQREAIFRVLEASRSHPSAEELFEQVRGDCPRLSLATVYNTLDVLCEAGLCLKLPVKGGSVRYDADLHPHLHVVDEETGQFVDVPEDLGKKLLAHLPTKLLAAVEQRLGMRISHVSLELFGRSDNGAVQRGQQHASFGDVSSTSNQHEA